MFGKVTINDQEIEFVATAATSFRFRNIFGTDLISILSHSDGENVEDYERLAFVMAKQAEGADMSKITEEDFYQWLEGFDPTDLYQALPKIVSIFMKNKQTTSDPK